MSVYLVTFQLEYESKHYVGLRDAIKSYHHWCHLSNNTWLVKPKKHNATEVRDYLSKHIFSGDKLIIIKIRKGWAAIGYSDRTYTWLRTHLTDI